MPNQDYNQQNPQGQQGPQGNDALDSARHVAEQKIDAAIDQFAQKIPGGQNYSQQAKDAAGNVLENLEQQLEQQVEQRGGVGNILGNIFHHNEEKK
jgi:type II secretory pathway component PulF